ncbi:glycerophosphodiester phosphodiesterase family protein [Glycomyces buryatensis]|uniref:glycerophosphodiester phosphodiesterase n=1 Tax=Glycomyces buryatensis TaxID=2570927 RepID=A0A4S8QQ20_9ACTN|nr:glycerophosphodiester phosphodiesterase family protein [Glycomyces buryatensis]THV42814.1 glycerophosphodiester phosphodiesterase [Glycomyces buryatensis]
MSRKGTLLRGLAAAAAGLVAIGFAAAPAQAKPHHEPATEPIVIAHRGASGYMPEHTLEAYKLAIGLGADVIEPDLVLTADGELVARHEPMLSGTTDVAEHPEFADRKTTKTIDGKAVTDWFADDFTLEELKTLRAEERIPDLRPQSAAWDGQFQLVTYDEVLDYLDATGSDVLTYPEMKHPSYYDEMGMSIEDALADVLEERDLDEEDSPVWVQSFEYPSLVEIDERIDNPVGLNIGGSGAISDADLDLYASTLDTISLNKDRIVPRDADGYLLEPTDVVDRAHDRGLNVHVWTFRNENSFLPADFRKGTKPGKWGDYRSEYELFYDLGVDAVFSDYPDKAVAAR